MNILFITIDVPMPSFASTARAFYALKYLPQKYGHKISLLSFRNLSETSEYIKTVEQYCEQVTIVEFPDIKPLSLKGLAYHIRNILSPQNVLSRHHSFLNYCYSPKMQAAAGRLLLKNQFDLIYVNWYSLIYCTFDISLPKILEVQEAASTMFYQVFKQEKKLIKKLHHLGHYFQTKGWERKYQDFNACIFPALQDVKALKSRFPNLNDVVIPPGVDTGYFKPINVEPDFPSLVFLGHMGVTHNIQGAIYFYNKIYPIIKKRLPSVKLYIVGRNPSKEIQQLATDDSVVVTGYVDDVRPYIAKATVFIAPHIAGMGIKTKIQEAMAMAMPIVTTSIGASGLNIPLDDSTAIGDTPQAFAENVIELLQDKQKRTQMGMKAMSLVKENYSWERATDRLNEVFQQVVEQK